MYMPLFQILFLIVLPFSNGNLMAPIGAEHDSGSNSTGGSASTTSGFTNPALFGATTMAPAASTMKMVTGPIMMADSASLLAVNVTVNGTVGVNGTAAHGASTIAPGTTAHGALPGATTLAPGGTTAHGAGATTMAPGTTAHGAPPGATTLAPGTTAHGAMPGMTTMAPGTTAHGAMPGMTTMAPGTTAHGAGATTLAPGTTAHGAPPGATTLAPGTTAHGALPGATTVHGAAPGATTMATGTTGHGAMPGASTMAPGTTAHGAAPGAITMAPGGTTAHGVMPGATTMAPGTTAHGATTPNPYCSSDEALTLAGTCYIAMDYISGKLDTMTNGNLLDAKSIQDVNGYCDTFKTCFAVLEPCGDFTDSNAVAIVTEFCSFYRFFTSNSFLTCTKIMEAVDAGEQKCMTSVSAALLDFNATMVSRCSRAMTDNACSVEEVRSYCSEMATQRYQIFVNRHLQQWNC